jgi:hypothetical protein
LLQPTARLSAMIETIIKVADLFTGMFLHRDEFMGRY